LAARDDTDGEAARRERRRRRRKERNMTSTWHRFDA
jgi:hypothetical protein